MKVRELIKKLAELDPEAIVIVSKDAEGNRFSPLSQIDTGWYQADSTWSGEIHEDSENPDRDDVKDLPRAVVLWPIN